MSDPTGPNTTAIDPETNAVVHIDDAADDVRLLHTNVGWIEEEQTEAKWGEQPGPSDFKSSYSASLRRVNQRIDQLKQEIDAHAENMHDFIATLKSIDEDSASELKRRIQ